MIKFEKMFYDNTRIYIGLFYASYVLENIKNHSYFE